MRMSTGNEITLTDPHRHKFGDALAEFVYDRLMAGGWDTVEDLNDSDLGESYARVTPKKILANDSNGFVDLWRFDTVALCDESWDYHKARFALFLANEEA